MSQEIIEAVREIERDKGIESGTLVAALEDALLAAYKKTPGATRHATVELDEYGDFRVFSIELPKDIEERLIDEAERAMMYDEYIDRVSEVVTGIVQQAGDRNNVLVDLGKVEALLPRSEQVDGERYEQGSRIKAVIIEVRSGTKGPQVILSRRAPQLIEALFELEVPEIADGLVEIRGVAREPGYRSKIAVESHAQGVDPVGACVGPRGSRVRMVVSDLAGPCPRGARGRRNDGGDRGRPRRPALARHRQGGAQRPSRRPADRLEDRHRFRVRVRPHRGRGGLRRRSRRRVLRPLRRGALQRQALPEHLG